jgi:hypothetical protein
VTSRVRAPSAGGRSRAGPEEANQVIGGRAAWPPRSHT